MSLHRNQCKSKRNNNIVGRGKHTINSISASALTSTTTGDDHLTSGSTGFGNGVNIGNNAHVNGGADCGNSFLPPSVQHAPQYLPRVSVDLKKDYIRYCKLYSSEPLEIVATPLERASFGRDPTFVDLKGRGLRGVDCIALGKILASDAPISHLNLSDCLLLPQGFQALLEGLINNTRLHTLELRGNNIQGTMICFLSRVLKNNGHLKRLLLEWNCLGASKDLFTVFCESLAENTGLEILDLRNNQLNAEAGIELAAALHKNKSIRCLDLRWNSIGVAGAKAIWDSLRTNFTLQRIQLCGNFIPDEIVSYIEQCLLHQSEREKMMEEYASRTHLLTRQLQKSEKNFKHEIDTMLNLFDVEEAELKQSLENATTAAREFESQLRAESAKTLELSSRADALQVSLLCANEKEKALGKALAMKDEHVGHLESYFKDQVAQLKSVHGRQLQMCQDELLACQDDGKHLRDKMTLLEGEFEGKSEECTALHEAVAKLNKSYSDLSQNFKERIKAEGEKWSKMKAEFESEDHFEIKQLENELKHMQSSMMEHIRHIENSKLDADKQVHALEMELLAVKANSEDSLTKLRFKLKEEQKQIVEAYKLQVDQLKEDKEKLETCIDLLNCQLAQVEGEKASSVRQNENLRKQISRMDDDEVRKETNEEISGLNDLVKKLQGENQALAKQSDGFRAKVAVLEKELSEKDSIICASLLRARNEVKELSVLMSANKIDVD